MSKFQNNYKLAKLVKGNVSLVSGEIKANELSPTSLVIKPRYMGICRADVKEVTSSRDVPEDRGPLFGHEFVGEIIYAGEETGFNEGETVTFNPNITPKRSTGFAEYFLIDDTRDKLEEAVIRTPKDLSVDPPWLAEPFACIVHSIDKLLEHSKLTDLSGKNVGLIGAGNSGILFGLLAKHLNASVHLFNRGQERIEFILKNNIFGEDELSKLQDFQKYKKQFDVVIVVPTVIDNEILEKANTLLKNDGYMLLYGGTRSSDKFLESDLNIDKIRREETLETFEYNGKGVRICGAYGCGRKDFEKAFELMLSYPDEFPLTKIVSKTIALKDLPSVMSDMSLGNQDFPGKVVVKP